jgi:hypothetical protein
MKTRPFLFLFFLLLLRVASGQGKSYPVAGYTFSSLLNGGHTFEPGIQKYNLRFSVPVTFYGGQMLFSHKGSLYYTKREDGRKFENDRIQGWGIDIKPVFFVNFTPDQDPRIRSFMSTSIGYHAVRITQNGVTETIRKDPAGKIFYDYAVGSVISEVKKIRFQYLLGVEIPLAPQWLISGWGGLFQNFISSEELFARERRSSQKLYSWAYSRTPSVIFGAQVAYSFGKVY